MTKATRKALLGEELQLLLRKFAASDEKPPAKELLRGVRLASELEAELVECKVNEVQAKEIFAALQTLPVVLFRHDAKGFISFASKSVKNLLGYPPEELIGEPLEKYVHPYDRSLLTDTLGELAKSKKTFFSFRFLKKKGEAVHIDGLSVLCPGGGKDSEREFFSLCRPCSERGACPAKEAAVESELLLAAFIGNTDQVVYMLSLDGIFEYVSPGWTKLLGHSVSEIEGKSFEPFIHKDDLAACKAYLIEVNKGNYPDKPIYRVRDKDGVYHWHSSNLSLVHDTSGNPTGFIGIASDISDKVDAFDQLKKSAAQYKHLFNSILDAAFIHTIAPDGTPGPFVQVNHVACVRMGRTEEELLKLSLSKITDPAEGQLHLREAMRKVLLEGSVRFESVHVNKDGRKILVEMTSTKFESDNSVYCLSLAHDISIRKRAEIELSVAHAAIEKAMRIKSEFLANMSHEIRTPMNGIIGLTKLLSETELSETQREYVSTIMLSADTLMDIVNDILDITKLEFGKVKIEEEPFTLLDPVREALKMVSHNAKSKGLELSFNSPGLEKTVVLGDAGRLRQVMLSLVNNAVKFTERGSIRVSVRLANRERQKAIVFFEVQDSGIGISKDKISEIFEKFYQEDASSTRKFGGLGLGLAIAKQLVELMGGEMKVESEKGVGSKFYFALPLRLANTPSSHRQDS